MNAIDLRSWGKLYAVQFYLVEQLECFLHLQDEIHGDVLIEQRQQLPLVLLRQERRLIGRPTAAAITVIILVLIVIAVVTAAAVIRGRSPPPRPAAAAVGRGAVGGGRL